MPALKRRYAITIEVPGICQRHEAINFVKKALDKATNDDVGSPFFKRGHQIKVIPGKPGRTVAERVAAEEASDERFVL